MASHTPCLPPRFLIAVIGAGTGARLRVLMAGCAMMVINGHDAFFMGLMSGPTPAAMAGLACATLGAAAIFLVWRTPATS